MKRVMLYINQLQYHELVRIHLALDSRGGGYYSHCSGSGQGGGQRCR